MDTTLQSYTCICRLNLHKRSWPIRMYLQQQRVDPTVYMAACQLSNILQPVGGVGVAGPIELGLQYRNLCSIS